MKFGIITLVSDNYGNKYQNYAVERLLSKYGEVTTYSLENLYCASSDSAKRGILQKLNPSYIKKVLRARMMYRFDYNATDTSIIQSLLYVNKNKKKIIRLKEERSRRFREFSKKYLHISDVQLNYENSVDENWIQSVDYFFCGSDQIWNPSYATTSKVAFCSFAPEKTVAIAPSFGVSEIPQYRKDEYSSYLKKIYKLSVRENVGRDIIKNLSGRDVEVLLDPTMALNVSEWRKIVKKPDVIMPEHYIVCYFLGQIDKVYRKKINEFAEKIGLPLVMLFDITSEEYYTFDPAEVLYTINNADFVLTDSFHGSVFSILFHRNFYVFGRNEGGASMNSRVETLLEKFQLTDRMFTGDSIGINSKKWRVVESILEEEQNKTVTYIENTIKIKEGILRNEI